MLPKPFLAPITTAVLALAAGAASSEPPASVLRQRYEELAPALAASALREPLHVESRTVDDRLSGEVYAELPFPFALLQRELRSAAVWCEIVPLHHNIKSCTHAERPGSARLTLFAGRKDYQPPEEGQRLDLWFRVVSDRPDGLEVAAVAERGPFGTRDFEIRLSAIPLATGASFIRLHYGYEQGFWARNAVGGYLRTLGSDKVGFTVVGRGDDGGPLYVDGLAGVIERNAVRYHLAVVSYLETLGVPSAARFERRIETWYALTERHRRQLFEVERDRYLVDKRRERRDQLRLQRALDAAHTLSSHASVGP